MASGLIVATIVLAAVAVLIAVLLRVRITRARRAKSQSAENAARAATADGGAASAAAAWASDADRGNPIATVFRRTGESDLAFRIRAAQSEEPEFRALAPRAVPPPTVSAPPPPWRSTAPGPASTEPGVKPASGLGSRRPHVRRDVAIAVGLVAVVVIGTSVAIVKWPGDARPSVGIGFGSGGVADVPATVAASSGPTPTSNGAGRTPGQPGGGGGSGGDTSGGTTGGGGGTGGTGGDGDGGSANPTPTPRRGTPGPPPPTATATPVPAATPTPSPTPTPTPTAKAPDVAFDVNVTGLTAKFKNHTTGATSWTWTFGDGSSSTARNPSHVYAAPGEYTVKLTAVGENGAVSSLSKRITVG